MTSVLSLLASSTTRDPNTASPRTSPQTPPKAPYQSHPKGSLPERSIRPLAGAQLAPDTQKRVHQNPSKRRMIRVRHPEHALRHWTIFHACRRPRASRAHLVDHRDDVRLAFPLRRRPLGNGLALLDLTVHISRHCRGIFSHSRSVNSPNSPTFSLHRAGKSTPSWIAFAAAVFRPPLQPLAPLQRVSQGRGAACETRYSAIHPENRQRRFEGPRPGLPRSQPRHTPAVAVEFVAAAFRRAPLPLPFSESRYSAIQPEIPQCGIEGCVLCGKSRRCSLSTLNCQLSTPSFSDFPPPFLRPLCVNPLTSLTQMPKSQPP